MAPVVVTGSAEAAPASVGGHLRRRGRPGFSSRVERHLRNNFPDNCVVFFSLSVSVTKYYILFLFEGFGVPL